MSWETMRIPNFPLIIPMLALVACGSTGGPSATTSAPALAKPAASAASASAKPVASGSGAPSTAAKPAAAGLGQPLTAKLQPNPQQWATLKDGAKKEGKVVVMGPGFPGLRQGFTEGFKKTHGVEVEYLGAAPGEALVRIQREAQAGKPSVDVYLTGSPSCWSLAEDGMIEDVSGSLVDPDILQPSVWRDGAPRLLKPSPKMPPNMACGIQGADWIMTDLFVNSKMVQPSAIKSWKDLLKPEYKGKITSHDPRVPGAGGATLAYVYSLFGEGFSKDLYAGQQVAFNADYQQLANSVGQGGFPIGMSLVQTTVEPLRKSGVPIERVFPEDGPGTTLGGFSVMLKIKNSPHPNAGSVFLNWFLSKEAQDMYERTMMETSLRTDVPHQVPEYVIPKPGVKYVDGYDPDFHFKYRVDAEAKVKEWFPR
ncbi:MAG TPA: extracellular solute-binding protein [Chloroflexota bacterium]|nr:extracellular solute-binding protein [Chloroflexota bacterium]